MIRRRLSRLSWLVAGAFQLLVPTLWSVTDARAEAASERAAWTHMEAAGTTGCVRAHPADCAICQAAANAPVPAEVAALPGSNFRPDRVYGWQSPAPPSRRAPGDPLQRAPPT